MKVKKFDDNSKLTWIDRESLLYEKGEYSIEIWVDWEDTGWFSSVRVIKMESLQKWDNRPHDVVKKINYDEQQDIIEKINSYFGHECLID